jgi:hypothetical protein
LETLILDNAGKHVPEISFAGGFVNETQIYKCIAMSNYVNNPAVKVIAIICPEVRIKT